MNVISELNLQFQEGSSVLDANAKKGYFCVAKFNCTVLPNHQLE